MASGPQLRAYHFILRQRKRLQELWVLGSTAVSLSLHFTRKRESLGLWNKSFPPEDLNSNLGTQKIEILQEGCAGVSAYRRFDAEDVQGVSTPIFAHSSHIEASSSETFGVFRADRFSVWQRPL